MAWFIPVGVSCRANGVSSAGSRDGPRGGGGGGPPIDSLLIPGEASAPVAPAAPTAVAEGGGVGRRGGPCSAEPTSTSEPGPRGGGGGGAPSLSPSISRDGVQSPRNCLCVGCGEGTVVSLVVYIQLCIFSFQFFSVSQIG